MLIFDSDIHIVSSNHAAINFKLAYGLQDIPLLQRDPNPDAQKPIRVIFHLTDRLLIQRDTLSWGPTPRCASVKDWQQVRTDHIRALFTEFPTIDFNDLKTDLLYNENRLNEVESIYIWAGVGLEDQLLILFVVYFLELTGGDPKKIKLVQFETFPGKSLKPVYALSYLDPIQIRAHPEPMALTQEHIELYRSGWTALTSDTPLPLMEFISSNQSIHKHLTSALCHLFYHYPSYVSGLDYWDTQLLSFVAKRGSLAGRIIGKVLGKVFESGDTVVVEHIFKKIFYLASSELTEPLLKLSGVQTSYRDTSVSLTKFGSAVMNGEASFYPTNPIDKWVGGVHLLSTTGNLWFYRDSQVIKVNEL